MSSYVDSFQITGNGGKATVEDECLLIRPRSRFDLARDRGDAFCWACVTQNFDAGDTMIGLQNSETTRTLYIERVSVSSATTSQIIVFGTSGVTLAGDNAITGVCLNRNFNRTPNASCYDDETGQDIAAASWPIRFASTLVLTGQTILIPFDGRVALLPTQFIGVDAVADIAGGNATIWGWFE